MLAAIVAALVAASAPAATSSVNVSMSVLSQTSITPGTCTTGSAGITSFGTVQPGTTFVAADCTIGFGSSNDTSRLLLSQQDGAGAAMFRFGDGELRTSFGGGGTGLVTHEPGGTDFTEEVVRQSTGRIVTGGYSTQATNRVITIGGFTSTGALDTTFGTSSGYTHIDLGANESVKSMVIYPDDSILLGGEVDNGATNYDYFMIRLLPNGTPDPGFGTGGVVERHLTGYDSIEGLSLLPDGRILATGETGNDIALYRFEADGDPDPTFAVNGLRTVNSGSNDQGSGIAIASDGTIIVAGHTQGVRYDWTLVRFDASGTVLSTTITPLGASANSYAYQPFVLSTGHVIAIGVSQPTAGDTDFTAVRYTAAGGVDTAWGTNGVVTRAFASGGSEAPLTRLQLPVDEFLIGGNVNTGSNRWFASKFRANGTWDDRFGTNGSLVMTSHVGSMTGAAHDVDGRVILAGSGNSGITLGMLDALPVADYADTGAVGDTDWTTGANTFGACLRAKTGANVVPTWGMTGACGVDDNDPWMPIAATTGAAGAEVARTNLAAATGSVTLRFGVRTALTQRPGTYVAPVTVSVLAP